MLLLPVNDTSASNMVFSKVRSWSDVNEREKNNNNPVKSDILRTPSRCTLSKKNKYKIKVVDRVDSFELH